MANAPGTSARLTDSMSERLPATVQQLKPREAATSFVDPPTVGPVTDSHAIEQAFGGRVRADAAVFRLTNALRAPRGGRTCAFDGASIRQLGELLQPHHAETACFPPKKRVIPARFERATVGSEDRCSIQLSYGTVWPSSERGRSEGEFTRRGGRGNGAK